MQQAPLLHASPGRALSFGTAIASTLSTVCGLDEIQMERRHVLAPQSPGYWWVVQLLNEPTSSVVEVLTSSRVPGPAANDPTQPRESEFSLLSCSYPAAVAGQNFPYYSVHARIYVRADPPLASI